VGATLSQELLNSSAISGVHERGPRGVERRRTSMGIRIGETYGGHSSDVTDE
jgi:hypothetical protein